MILLSVGLCFGFFFRFALSSRCTGGGVPRTSRAMDLTAVVARNLRVFFFFGKHQIYHVVAPPSCGYHVGYG